ncbi:MAG: DUF695 domain-containing protein [Deltaproteobacteria bacterium]|nr:DUF695 domain-containing protein [Deltaproteobacteria bacterium]
MSDWDFYEGTMDSDRAFIAVDLSLKTHAPLASHPTRLQVRFAMLQPREDGLRSAEEADAVFALEDRVVEAMACAAKAMFVARTVAQGYTELFFYVPADQKQAANDPPAAVGRVAPYELEWYVEDDPRWDTYQELYPNRYAIQSIMNRRLVQQMTEVGDQIAVAREIDHLALFSREEQAREAARGLAERGFRVDEPHFDEDRWSLQFHRNDSCEGNRPDEFVFEILDLIGPFDGEYDGWGSVVVKG